jgi:amino acid permease
MPAAALHVPRKSTCADRKYCHALQGDIFKVRQAILGGLSIPLVMFITWNGAILGSLDREASSGNSDPLVQLMQQSSSVGLLIQVRGSVFSTFGTIRHPQTGEVGSNKRRCLLQTQALMSALVQQTYNEIATLMKAFLCALL